MTEIEVPNTAQHIAELRQNLEQIAAGGTNRSPRNIAARAKPYVEQTTTKVAQETVSAIEATHRMADNGSDQPLSVYHYTNIDTAIALLKSAGEYAFLRMYSSQGFNDPDEGQYLHRSTIGLLNSQQMGFLPEMRQDDEPIPSPNCAYIASFIFDEAGSAADNNIPYWTNYGDYGNGVAIKLAVPRQSLYAVKYGEANAKQTMAILCKHLEPLLETVKNLDNEELLSTAKAIIQKSLQRLNFLYKSSYYAYERECRVIELPGRTELTPQAAYEGKHHAKPFRSYLSHPDLSSLSKGRTWHFPLRGRNHPRPLRRKLPGRPEVFRRPEKPVWTPHSNQDLQHQLPEAHKSLMAVPTPSDMDICPTPDIKPNSTRNSVIIRGTQPMPAPAETRKEARILALILGGFTAVLLTLMILMSDFLGAYQVKEGQNCPPGGICHNLGWAGLFGIALTGYGIGLGWAV